MFEYGVHPHQGRRTGDLIRAKNPPMTKGKPGTRYFLEKPLGEGADDGPKRMVERHGGSEGKKSVHEIAIDQGTSRNKPSRGGESTVASPFQSTYAVSSAGRGREAPQRRLLFCLSLSLSLLLPHPPPCGLVPAFLLVCRLISAHIGGLINISLYYTQVLSRFAGVNLNLTIGVMP